MTLPPTPPTPRWLYLHGFASGPSSTKGLAFERHFARLGAPIERLDLRIPSMEHLRPSAMIAHARDRIGGAHDRAVLIGSSLGGLVAARVAEADARVGALVLMAPAFCLLDRWRARLGAETFGEWAARDWLEVDDHATRGKSRVDYGFVRDLEPLDATSPDAPDVRAPALIIHGVRDETVPIDSSRAWARGKRHVELIEVDDGHELVASLPRILTEAERFLAPWLGR